MSIWITWDELDDGTLAMWDWTADPSTDSPTRTLPGDEWGHIWPSDEWPVEVVQSLIFSEAFDAHQSGDTERRNILGLLAAFDRIQRR